NNAYFYSDAANSALSFHDYALADKWATKNLELYPRFGPPRSQKGYLALLDAQTLAHEAEVLRAKGPARAEEAAKLTARANERFDEAVRLLKESLGGNWYSDESGRAIAGSNLA